MVKTTDTKLSSSHDVPRFLHIRARPGSWLRPARMLCAILRHHAKPALSQHAIRLPSNLCPTTLSWSSPSPRFRTMQDEAPQQRGGLAATAATRTARPLSPACPSSRATLGIRLRGRPSLVLAWHVGGGRWLTHGGVQQLCVDCFRHGCRSVLSVSAGFLPLPCPNQTAG